MLAVSFSQWSNTITFAMSWSVMWFLLFFLVGFVALASLLRGVNGRGEDVQIFTSPLMHPIMIIYF